jgi:hypothetical protein
VWIGAFSTGVPLDTRKKQTFRGWVRPVSGWRGADAGLIEGPVGVVE